MIDLKPTNVWKDLSTCDVHSAAIKAFTANFLLLGNLECTKNGPSQVLNDCGIVTNEARTALSKTSVSRDAKKDLSAVIFLIDVSFSMNLISMM